MRRAFSLLLAASLTALAVCGQTNQPATQKSPVKLFIEAREKGNRNVTLELTRDLTKSCPSVVSVSDGLLPVDVQAVERDPSGPRMERVIE